MSTVTDEHTTAQTSNGKCSLTLVSYRTKRVNKVRFSRALVVKNQKRRKGRKSNEK